MKLNLIHGPYCSLICYHFDDGDDDGGDGVDDGDGVDNDGGDDDRRQKTCPPEGRTAARIGREEPFKAFTMKSCASCEKL